LSFPKEALDFSTQTSKLVAKTPIANHSATFNSISFGILEEIVDCNAASLFLGFLKEIIDGKRSPRSILLRVHKTVVQVHLNLAKGINLQI
jgi:hypothetical protein